MGRQSLGKRLYKGRQVCVPVHHGQGRRAPRVPLGKVGDAAKRESATCLSQGCPSTTCGENVLGRPGRGLSGHWERGAMVSWNF